MTAEAPDWEAIWRAAEFVRPRHPLMPLFTEVMGVTPAKLPGLVGLRLHRGVAFAGLKATLPATIGAVVGGDGMQGIVAWPLLRTARGAVIPFAQTIGQPRGGIVPVSWGSYEPIRAGLVLVTEIKDAIALAAPRPEASIAFVPEFGSAAEIKLPAAVRRCVLVPPADGAFGMEALFVEAAESMCRNGRRAAVVERKEVLP